MLEDFFIALSESPFTYPILSIIIGVCIFVLGRFLFCWYWKIDERIKLQNQEVNLLVEIIDKQDEEICVLRDILKKLSNANNMNIEMMNEAAATEEDDPE